MTSSDDTSSLCIQQTQSHMTHTTRKDQDSSKKLQKIPFFGVGGELHTFLQIYLENQMCLVTLQYLGPDSIAMPQLQYICSFQGQVIEIAQLETGHLALLRQDGSLQICFQGKIISHLPRIHNDTSQSVSFLDSSHSQFVHAYFVSLQRLARITIDGKISWFSVSSDLKLPLSNVWSPSRKKWLVVTCDHKINYEVVTLDLNYQVEKVTLPERPCHSSCADLADWYDHTVYVYRSPGQSENPAQLEMRSDQGQLLFSCSLKQHFYQIVPHGSDLLLVGLLVHKRGWFIDRIQEKDNTWHQTRLMTIDNSDLGKILTCRYASSLVFTWESQTLWQIL